MTKGSQSSENSGFINNFIELIESATDYTNSNSTEGFIKSIKITKSFKYYICIVSPFTFFYVLGFVYNNLQNPSRLFSSAWFFDSIILSWTNLLILPILIFVTAFGIFRKIKWQEEFGIFIFVHLISPFLWIIGYLVLRFFVKTYELFSILISDALKFLAN